MMISIFNDLAQILLDYAVEAGVAVLSFFAGLLIKKKPKEK